MTLADVLLFLFAGLSLAGVALIGALVVGGLICTGVFLAKFVSKKLPELWEKIP